MKPTIDLTQKLIKAYENNPHPNIVVSRQDHTHYNYLFGLDDEIILLQLYANIDGDPNKLCEIKRRYFKLTEDEVIGLVCTWMHEDNCANILTNDEYKKCILPLLLQ